MMFLKAAEIESLRDTKRNIDKREYVKREEVITAVAKEKENVAEDVLGMKEYDSNMSMVAGRSIKRVFGSNQK
jgi:hypothetical protein